YGRDERVTIAPLTRIIDLHRQARHPFDHEFSGLRRMPTRSASRNIDLLCSFELCFRYLHFIKEDVTSFLRDAAQSCIPHGTWLLVNFLQHEMLEPALFGHDGVPGDMLNLPNDLLSIEVGELYALWRNHGQIAIGEEK